MGNKQDGEPPATGQGVRVSLDGESFRGPQLTAVVDTADNEAQLALSCPDAAAHDFSGRAVVLEYFRDGVAHLLTTRVAAVAERPNGGWRLHLRAPQQIKALRQRGSPRVPLPQPVRFAQTTLSTSEPTALVYRDWAPLLQTHGQPGQLDVINVNGLRIRTPTPCALDCGVVVELQLSQKILRLPGRVVWLGEQPHTALGIEFVGLTATQRRELGGLIDAEQTLRQNARPPKGAAF